MIIDSIQTMEALDCPSAPGSVAQVRLSTTRLQEVAKSLNTTILITGHVTKTGDIAGPRTLEHMVDTVLYMVFDMTETGLEEVPLPALSHVENGPLLLFLDKRPSRPRVRLRLTPLRRLLRRHLAERLHVTARRGKSSRYLPDSSKHSPARSARSTDRPSVAASASPSTGSRCSWRC